MIAPQGLAEGGSPEDGDDGSAATCPGALALKDLMVTFVPKGCAP